MAKRKGQFLFILAGHFWVDLSITMFPPLLPIFIEKFGISMTIVGLITSLSAVTSSWSQPVLGYLVDRWRPYWLLAASVLWTSFLTAAMGVAQSVLVLTLVLCLAGLGNALYHPLGTMLAVEQAKSSSKGLATSTYITIGNLGVAVAPLISVPLVVSFGLPSLALLLLPGVLVAFGLLRSLKVEASDLSAAVSSPTCSSHGCSSSADAEASNLSVDVSRNAAVTAVAMLNAIMGLRMWSIRNFNTFLATYYVSLGYSEVRSGLFLSLYLLTIGLGTLVGGWISDRVGPRLIILLSGVASLVGTAFFVLIKGSVLLSLVSLVVSGLGSQFAMPSALLLAQFLAPRRAGMVSGMMLGMSFGVGGLGVVLTGVIADYFGLMAAFASSVPILAISVLIVYLMPWQHIHKMLSLTSTGLRSQRYHL